eukprot:CAMPEP_0178985294 /NCGR_PEP_ID=MMETSP0795-20121207/2070_1 /TAXON_ID=88552 /ORGANISM="Amoebophrya sp., Strain Ameob2" /LENGTH=141 /DNA_ID=CAMNT_0020676231 /DNA_START=735 /DNA_END=1157 /DNA_ORIENTATION=+
MGDISVHVISKLGKPSVANATVEVFYYGGDKKSAKLLGAGNSGWELLKTTSLSEHGGNDELVPIGELKVGLYALQFDFSKFDDAAKTLYRKNPETSEFEPLNPGGWFLGACCCFVLDITDAGSFNHLVLSMGDKEITARPG